MVDTLGNLSRAGGPVLWVLAALSALLWWMVARRWQILRALQHTPVRGLEARLTAESYARPIRSMVKVAPLLGLLGTVSGMIQTFSGLAHSAGVAEGAVAGGISEALLTTQLGLVIAIPALLVSRLLDRKAQRLTGGSAA